MIFHQNQIVLFTFRDERDKLENTVLEKQFNNDVKEDRMAKPEYENAKISLPKHYYRETKISRDKIAESKDQMNEINRKNEDYSNKIMKKVSLTKIIFRYLITTAKYSIKSFINTGFQLL